MNYRYRYQLGHTRGARSRFDRILAKLGNITLVRGYRYLGRYNVTHEAVLLKGEHGSARFSGLLWGYGGEGPRGTCELLQKKEIGLTREDAEQIAFNTERKDDIGVDWEIVPPKVRLEYLRSQIDAECISYGEIAELQDLTPYIEEGDVQLLEWAGVPEFAE